MSKNQSTKGIICNSIIELTESILEYSNDSSNENFIKDILLDDLIHKNAVIVQAIMNSVKDEYNIVKKMKQQSKKLYDLSEEIYKTENPEQYLKEYVMINILQKQFYKKILDHNSKITFLENLNVYFCRLLDKLIDIKASLTK